MYLQLDNKMTNDELKACLEIVTSACCHIGSQIEREIKDYMLTKSILSNDADV